ncbi:MAG: thioredoxin domain-containing protein [Candidatus Wallbacteria bacterium]|nr:thioredoxin domain-containing protein [Candidatus Wallbacteria bacterium]
MNGATGANRLAAETSPYLLQHASNPVDWYPWGDEAFAAARAQDKPILLSVGYAACHWCHVMAHESFEDAAIAQQMNEGFVCVKVDREERPDVDEIYMAFVQGVSGHGGWPMTVFLMPDGRPFFGGTYYPPEDRWGMAGFPTILRELTKAYRERREDVERSAASWTSQLERLAFVPDGGQPAPVTSELIDLAVDRMSSHFDEVHGGFGGAPKFPHSMDLGLFMRTARRRGRLDLMSQVRTSLEKMAAGGIYDQLGGGFHRYSVDDRWAVPHFEKMLYDNALLARAYLEGYLVTGEEDHARVARETLDYMLAEMRDPAGGFWSSQDADSEGEEGKFFVWTPDEIKALLPAGEGEVFCACYGVEPGGNFEGGRTVLHARETAETYAAATGRDAGEVAEMLRRGRATLLEARRRRVAPGTDDKVLTAWNGLAISAFAEGARVLGEERYREAATRAAEFVLSAMSAPDGGLLRTYRAGKAKLNGYLEDYASLALALTDLYETTFETRWLQEARRLCSLLMDRFHDAGQGGFHFTSRDHEKLLVRTKPYQDGATPSGTSMAVLALLRVARLTSDEAFETAATRTLELLAPIVRQAPSAFPFLLIAADFALAPPVEIAFAGDPADPTTRALIDVAHRAWLPGRVLALRRPGDSGAADEQLVPMLAGKRPAGSHPAVYVCRNRTCSAPLTTADSLAEELEA